MPTEDQIQKIKDVMVETEPEVKTEYQAEVEKITATIKNQEHALRVNKLFLTALLENDYVPITE